MHTRQFNGDLEYGSIRRNVSLELSLNNKTNLVQRVDRVGLEAGAIKIEQLCYRRSTGVLLGSIPEREMENALHFCLNTVADIPSRCQDSCRDEKQWR